MAPMEQLIVYALGLVLTLMFFYFVIEIYFDRREKYIDQTILPLIKELKRGETNKTLPVPTERPQFSQGQSQPTQRWLWLHI